MLENIEGLSGDLCISVEISKGTIIMVCTGSYHPSLGGNRGASVWVIHCTYTDIYPCLSLHTTSQVDNSNRSELTGIYSIVALLESVCQLNKLEKLEVEIICNNE